MRIKLIIFIGLLIMSLTACSLATIVGKDQVKYTINDDLSVTMEGYLNQDNIEGFFDMSYDLSEDEMIESIQTYYKDKNTEITLNDYNKKSNYSRFNITYKDPSIIFIELSATLLHFSNSFYKSYEDMIQVSGFLAYDSGDLALTNDYTGLEEATILIVSGYDAGAYYSVPGEILLVSDEMPYKKRGSNTIFIEANSYGHIIYLNKE